MVISIIEQNVHNTQWEDAKDFTDNAKWQWKMVNLKFKNYFLKTAFLPFTSHQTEAQSYPCVLKYLIERL